MTRPGSDARIEFRPEAFADVAEAFSYYEAQRRGLGGGFRVRVGADSGPLAIAR